MPEFLAQRGVGRVQRKGEEKRNFVKKGSRIVEKSGRHAGDSPGMARTQKPGGGFGKQ